MQIKEHHFDIEDAKKHGVNKAILLYNLKYWLDKNKANRRNIHQHKSKLYYWTYNSANAFSKLFPYFSVSSIDRWLRELETDGYLISANYNKIKFDKTKWYAIPEVKATLGEYEECANKENRMDEFKGSVPQNEGRENQNGGPIPDNKPDNKHLIGNSEFSKENPDSIQEVSYDTNTTGLKEEKLKEAKALLAKNGYPVFTGDKYKADHKPPKKKVPSWSLRYKWTYKIMEDFGNRIPQPTYPEFAKAIKGVREGMENYLGKEWKDEEAISELIRGYDKFLAKYADNDKIFKNIHGFKKYYSTLIQGRL